MRAALVIVSGIALVLPGAPAVAQAEAPDSSTPVAIAGIPRGSASQQAGGSIPPPPTDRVILRWKANTDRSARAQVRASVRAEDFAGLGKRFQVLVLRDGQDPAVAVSRLKADPRVAGAARDGYSELHAPPDDTYFSSLWGLDNQGQKAGGATSATPGADIDALEAWTRTVGDSTVIVADLDDGIRPNHPDLKNRIWTNPDEIAGDGIDNDSNGYVDDTFGYDFAGDDIDNDPLVFDNDPTDDIFQGGHGTHTAGTIAAQGNNAAGITGVAQNATLMPIRVCGLYSGDGGVYCLFSSQIAGINYAGSNGARIANMSLGGTSANSLVRDAFAANPHVLFVVSAGNAGQNVEEAGKTTYPCSWDPSTSGIAGAVDNVVCVAASDQNDAKAEFSNWGKAKVDLAAPGTETLSTYPWFTAWSEDFEQEGFPTDWQVNDAWVRTSSSPLGQSFVITNDTPTQATSSSRAVTSPAVSVSGSTQCGYYSREIFERVDSDSLVWEVLVDGKAVLDGTYDASYSGTYYDSFSVTGPGPHTLAVRYTYQRQTGPASNGFWLDYAGFDCWTPPGSENASNYAFLQGTSMAAPHVTGAAALLAAYEPTATTMQIKQALLSSVDAVAQFHPDTGSYPVVTGGRLNADKALVAVDALVAPQTRITSGPSGRTKDTSATVEFTSDAATPVTFECSVDDAAFSACTSPFTINGLGLGDHEVAVRAVDQTGNDPTPATVNWTVYRDPPDTRITSGPSGRTKDTSATVEFTSDAATPVTFECSVDDAAFAACTSPFTITGLALGDHTVTVRAVDEAGYDPTPATASWTVYADPVQPQVTAPAAVTGLTVKRKKRSAVIHWATSTGATSYRVHSAKGTHSLTGTTYTLKRLSPRKRYVVTVTALNAAGSSPEASVTVKRYRKR